MREIFPKEESLFFTFLRIPVRICPTFLLFVLFFSRLYAEFRVENGILAAVFFISLLVHEYGHALTASYFGAKPSISLEAFGGRSEYNTYRISSRQQFWITLNGPLLQSSFIFIPYLLLKIGVFSGNYYLQYALVATLQFNILWCVMNLVPIIPLDGGRLLGFLLEKKYKTESLKISSLIGVCCAITLIPVLCYYKLFFFAVTILFLGWQNWKVFSSFQKESQFSLYQKALRSIEENNLKLAESLLKKLLHSKDVKIKNAAAESLAKVYFQENKEKKSYELLLQADQESLYEGKFLLCKLAFQQKNYKLVAEHSRKIYQYKPCYEVAILNSKAFACLGDAYYAGAWLLTASNFSEDSKEKARQLLETSLYDTVRLEEDFCSCVKALREEVSC